MTPATRVHRFQYGVSIAEIAKQDGVSFSAVLAYLRKRGVITDSYLSDEFEKALASADGIPTPEKEYLFKNVCPNELRPHFQTPKTKRLRGWKTDFAFPFHSLAVEVDGGSRMAGGGRHNKPSDKVKGNAYAVCGWRVLHFDTDMLTDPAACVAVVKLALRGDGQ